jgi:very-short-patch-repair endonuclease
MSPTETSLATIASRQGGIVTREQVIESGMSRTTLWRRTRAGLLVPTGARTFRLASVAATPEGAVLAACLDRDGTASHRTAAWVHGLRDRPPSTDILILRRNGRWSSDPGMPGVVVHTTTDLPEEDLTEVRGIPVTSVARTLMTLAAMVPRDLTQEELAETLAVACERRLASERWLFWLLERRRISGRDGVIAFEEALAARLHLGPTESWLERTTLRLVEDAGLPRPQVQRRVARRGRFVSRVDFAYDARPVVVEALGYAHHRTRADLERDTRRANKLQLAGKIVLQFSYDQIVGDPSSVVSDIAEALGIALAAAA